jgi:hypothetical protein
MSLISRLIALAAFAVCGSAWAGPFSLWVGQKHTLFISQKVSRLEVSDLSVAEVKKVRGVGLEIAARAPGVAEIRISTADGTAYAFKVHVTRGAEVYSVNRSEPEHSGWSLSSSEVKPADPRTARQRGKKSPRRAVSARSGKVAAPAT